VPVGIPQDLPSNVKIFHAGTKFQDDSLVSSGGRVLGISATADSLSEARLSAYRVCDKIEFAEMHFRRDIAASSV